MVKWIILSLLLLLVFLLWSKIKLSIKYNNDVVKVSIRYLFFRMQLLPEVEKKKKRKKRKVEVEPFEQKPKENKRNLFETITTILDFLKALPDAVKYLLKKLSIAKLNIYIRVAGDDAAETGIEYGRTCAIVHGALAALRNIFTIHVKAIKIEPDFVNYESEIKIEGEIKIRLYAAVLCAIKYFISYFKVIRDKDTENITLTKEIKGGAKNESTSN